ncbi:MAG TPA: CDP-alcohol phosphatidyltransferase family protein [Longimicrobiaceae bacterium]|nr:CDP-alcohol phosphatidyltransferase family protein [Longimicrobiaceae bacterium]
MSPSAKSIPNLLTALRLLLLPLLWWLVLTERTVWLGVGIAIAGITDKLDGVLARRLNATSAWGSRFDSMADHLLFGSMLVWMVLLRPEFIREQAVPIVVWIVLGIASFLVGWFKFRRVADLHLDSARRAVFLSYLFMIHLLVFEEYSRLFFYVAVAANILGASETLLVLLTRDRVDEHIGTVLSGRGRHG